MSGNPMEPPDQASPPKGDLAKISPALPAPPPPRRGPQPPSRLPWLFALAGVLAALAIILYFWLPASQPLPGEQAAATPQPLPGQEETTPGQAPAPPAPSKIGPVVEIQPGDATPGAPGAAPEGAARAQEQANRKAPYGLKDSVDAVVRTDETVKLGGNKVSVKELERKLVVEGRGDILDKPLGGSPKVAAWGIHVMRPGENLWKVHLELLKEYLASRGRVLPPGADQPTPGGRSSGVGKVLKFAEHMVGVYNLRTGAMTRNLNLLEPGQKIVVFNLSEIFGQLNQVDIRDLSGISYDGRVLLFPEEMERQPASETPPAPPAPPAPPGPSRGPVPPPQ
ncbi:MAG: hypothetical protein KQJ78_05065 [Deltaproteobacteria bacterium]|nr:hypothetical protein [Deltaproteobacteria bacterium]